MTLTDQKLPIPDSAAEHRYGRRPPKWAGAPRAALSNLDKRALLDRLKSEQPSERRFSVRHFRRSGVVEIGWGAYRPEQHTRSIKKVTPERQALYRIESGKRAAAELRRSLLAIGADRMVTLTYRANMTDRKQGLIHLGQFNRIMKREDSTWESVSVLEFQKRGAVHFHVGLGGFHDVNVMRAAWLSVVGDGGVHLSFQNRGGGNGFSKCASYMAKYLTKSDLDNYSAGQHRYFKTQQVEDGRRQVYFIPKFAPQGTEETLALEIIQQCLCPNGGWPSSTWFAPPGMCNSGFAVGVL